MKKKASELIFISRIKRDGSGALPVSSDYKESMIKSEEEFDIYRLSISESTYIAIGFNAFVAKLK